MTAVKCVSHSNRRAYISTYKYLYSISTYLQLCISWSTFLSSFNQLPHSLLYHRPEENFFIYHFITSFKGSHGIRVCLPLAPNFSSLRIVKLQIFSIKTYAYLIYLCTFVYLCSEIINLLSMPSCSVVCCQLHEIIEIEIL